MLLCCVGSTVVAVLSRRCRGGVGASVGCYVGAEGVLNSRLK